MTRVHFTPGGASWIDADPTDCWLCAEGLNFEFIQESFPEATYSGWVSPIVNEMEQVVLRTIWGTYSGVPGWALYMLMFASVDEDHPDPIGSGTVGYMLVWVDLSMLTGDYLQDMIDIDVSHFFGGDDVSHCLCHMTRVPLEEPEEDVPLLTLMNIRTLTPAEVELAPNIHPWEEMPI